MNALFRTEEDWRTSLEAMKAELRLSDQELAVLLGSSQAIINKIRRGIHKMPLVVKLHLLDRAAYVSVRDKVLTVLPPEISARLQEMNNEQLKDSAGRKLRNLPPHIGKLLVEGEEREAWNLLLDEARERFGSDVKVGQLIGASKSMISVARAGVSRLTPSTKVELLDKLDYRVSDELLMSLLQVDGYTYLRQRVGASQET